MSRAWVLVALAGCHSASPSTPSPAAPADARLSVEVQLYVTRAGKRVEVPPAGTVHSNEGFDFEVMPSRAAYIYVGYRHADGTTDVLFPERGTQVLVDDAKLEIPSRSGDTELAFDDHTGDESLVVIASLEPLSQADADTARLVFPTDADASSAKPDTDAGVPAPAPVPAPPIVDAGTGTVTPPAPAPASEQPKPHSARPKVTPARSADPLPVRLSANIGIAKGVVRRSRRHIIDADSANVVIFPYVVHHID